MAGSTKVRTINYSPDEFLVGVAGMRPLDIAVYWVACSLIYSSGREIPLNDERLFRIIKARKPEIDEALGRLTAIPVVGDPKLIRNGDLITNKRASKEIKGARKRIRNSRGNGANGGRPRKHSKDLENPGVLSPGSDGENLSSSPSPPPSSSEGSTPVAPKGAGKRAKVKKPTEYSHAFNTFWDLYPHKVAKDAAWKAWLKLIEQGRMPTPEVLAAAIANYVATKPADRSWANPATWLNGGRWMDAPAAEATSDVGKPISAEPPPNLKGWRLAFWKGEGDVSYRSWIDGAEVSKNAEGIVTMMQPTRFRRDHVRNNFAEKLVRYMRAEDPAIKTVKIELAEGNA